MMIGDTVVLSADILNYINLITVQVAAHGWTGRTVTMVKIALEIFMCIGIVVVYIFALIAATMIAVKIQGNEYADDIDYAMTANVIQFFVMELIIAEKVVQWMT